jgi:UV DNA damage repair endonuclease
MLVSIDETAGFMNSFKGITTDYPIQFLQLASDDRTVLPRIVRDVEKHQIIFQLFDYRD